jgi:hypothetical protein
MGARELAGSAVLEAHSNNENGVGCRTFAAMAIPFHPGNGVLPQWLVGQNPRLCEVKVLQ